MNSSTKMDLHRKVLLTALKLETLLLKIAFAALHRDVFMVIENRKLIKSAVESCESETVRRWLRENSGSVDFSQLTDMFNFLKRQIDAEESKLHSGHVDIVFIAHGSIRGSMVPACCLLPLTTITDVLLYAPWNCVMSAEAAEGVASGRMKPHERVFHSLKAEGRSIPSEKHHPKDLPDHWNSMKQAGHQKIPNIMLSPLASSQGPIWKKFTQSDRNRIVIPYIDPESSKSVPFFVITLALSLVLRSSRFQATVHLVSCLSDQSTGEKFNWEYLKQQYAYTVDNTVMTWSPDSRRVEVSLMERLRRWFGYTPA